MSGFFPELGRHTFAVLGSYGASLVLLVLLVGVSLWQARRAKGRLDAYEREQKTEKPR